jgi:hypothetical protein
MTELVDVATVVERDTVRIRTKKNPDGRLYTILNLSDLGPYEHWLISNRNERAEKLSVTTRPLTPQEKREVRKALGDILSIIVPSIEPATLNEMENITRAQIVLAWVSKVNGAGAVVGDTGNPPKPQTGAASSRASRRSTAATRMGGSTRRRGS